MAIEKKILSIFRALEALPKTAPGPEGYRDTKRTLVEEDINPIHEKIRTALKEKINAELRS